MSKSEPDMSERELMEVKAGARPASPSLSEPRSETFGSQKPGLAPQGRIPDGEQGPVIPTEWFFWAAIILAPLGAILAVVGAILS